VHFSPRQRHLAISALEEAEVRTSDYYCIPPFRWQSVRYDLLTRQDPEWQPLPDGMLARTRRLQRERHPWDFFRIELNDPGILVAAHRENLRTALYPFLLYILTHEMVHLVRLSHILADSEQHSATRDTEELRVSQIVRSILAVTPTPGLDDIVRRFSFCSASHPVKGSP
jgi:hypothetical protein